jgi:hypothetical protein
MLAEWHPECLPIGSFIIIIGRARAAKTTFARSIVSRMHERYDECIVFGTDPEVYHGSRRGTIRDDVRKPGPPRLVVIHEIGPHTHGYRTIVQGCGVSVILTRSQLSVDPDVDAYVFFDRRAVLFARSDHPFMARYDEAQRARLAEYTKGLGALVVTATDAAWYAADPAPCRPCWTPWTIRDLRACWRRRRTPLHGDTRIERNVLARLVALHAARCSGRVASTCRQWRLAMDDVPLLIDVRHSPRFDTPAGVPNVGRVHGVEWYGVLRRLGEDDGGCGGCAPKALASAACAKHRTPNIRCRSGEPTQTYNFAPLGLRVLVCGAILLHHYLFNVLLEVG